MAELAITVAKRNLLAAQSFLAMSDSEIELTLSGINESLQFTLVFQTVKDESPSLTVQANEALTNAEIKVVNWDIKLGGAIAPEKVGTFDGRDLFLVLAVWTIGDTGQSQFVRKIDVCFFVGSEVRNGQV